VLLYAAVEGNSPFRQNTPLSTLRAIVDEPLPPPQRAGPLTPVIQGLLAKDPAQRLGAEQAEHELRIVAAGGTLTTTGFGPPLPIPQAPTLAGSPQTSPGSTPPMPYGPADATVASAGSTAEPDRNRRAAVVLIAGMVALALALGGLTYALLNRDNGDGGGAAVSSGTGGVSSAPETDNSGSDQGASSGSPSTSAPPTESPTTTSPPAQSVQVTVAGAHTEYSGACPPPDAQAPTFTATFTVGRVPAEVEYRWVTETGEVSDPGWKTLSFPASGGRTQQKTVIVTTYDESGTYENEIGVEIRSPVNVTSNSVAFSVTCVTETPTGEASASESP
jgi:hypothetical protein